MAHVTLLTSVSVMSNARPATTRRGLARSSTSVDDTISFLRGGTVVLGLFGSDDLAADATVEFAADGYAPVALAMNLGSRVAVDAALATAEWAGRDDHGTFPQCAARPTVPSGCGGPRVRSCAPAPTSSSS